MVEMLEREERPTILDKVLSRTPTPRVESLREALLLLKPTASIERARTETWW